MKKSLPPKSHLTKNSKRDYQEMQWRENLVGLTVFTCGVNKVAGFQVNVEGLRLELGLNRLQVPHITTSFKSFGRKTQGEAER